MYSDILQIFKMSLSLSFHNYKIVFKVRISYPLQTKYVDACNKKETRPGDHESSQKYMSLFPFFIITSTKPIKSNQKTVRPSV